MAKRKRSAVRKYHDRVARRYDAIYEDDYWQFHDALTWDYLKPHLPRDLSAPVVDLGCGTGKWAFKLSQSGYHVTCVDVAGAMVEQARRKFEEAGRADRASFVQADLCDLSALPRHHFALAMAFGEPICAAASPAQALKQIRACLQPGGALVATIDNRLAALDYYLEHGSLEDLGRFAKVGRTHWLTRDKEEQFEIHTFTPSQAVRLFETAGFEVIKLVGKTVLPVRQFRDRLKDPDVRRVWMRIEKALAHDTTTASRAAHLQIAARVAG